MRISHPGRAKEIVMQQREILCIDDDVQSLEVRKILLETFDYHVTIATNVRDGLKLFKSRAVDAVVLDYQMPEMDGGQMARKIKSLRPEVPVLVLSALPWLPKGAPRECIDTFMTKGEPTSKLVHEIEQLIDSAPVTPKSRMRAARVAGAVMGVVAEKVLGVNKAKSTTKPLTQAPARIH
jgi:CheY-like chemotaxis protein